MPDDTTTPTSTPTVDTSLPAGFSLYEPQLKKGVHRLLCQVLDFAPSVSQLDGNFQGWTVTLALLQPAPDEIGGQLETGTRLPRMTLFTQASQYRTTAQATESAVATLMGLNNIAFNRRNKASCDSALAAYNALPPERRLPLPGQDDRDPSHYEQWKGTQVVAVLKAAEKDGEVRLNCLGLEAASTAKV